MSQSDVPVNLARVEISLATRGVVRDVVLDPDYQVFHANPALRAEASALRYWVEGNLHRINGRPHEGSTLLREGLRKLPPVDPYGVEFLLRFHLAAIEQEENDLLTARRDLELALRAPSRIPGFLPLAYLRLGQIAKRQGDATTVTWAVRNVQSAERSLRWELGISKEAQALIGKP